MPGKMPKACPVGLHVFCFLKGIETIIMEWASV